MNVTNILIAQPEPTGVSPYIELIEKHKLIIDFVPFIRVESLSTKEFRTQRIDVLRHTAIVFTARTAVDMFFRLCEEMRITIPETMKYFCTTEATANYLQKYIVYRKRKIFFGNGTIASLFDTIGIKHHNESFLIILAEGYKPDVPKAFDKAKLKHSKAVFYRTVNTDVSQVDPRRYDMLVFYTPAEVKAFVTNFPKFKQGKTFIASFGATTAKVLKENGFSVAIEAPTPKAPSIVKALDLFLEHRHFD
ncbi:MAG: uroporphyrinogen-III synthase [Prevotellaceae bacterium]|jgi:uroporphyrinogen-III synthase|nr:uroporphyrinogen-III synthase [Prevotellaceae bacterium]